MEMYGKESGAMNHSATKIEIALQSALLILNFVQFISFNAMGFFCYKWVILYKRNIRTLIDLNCDQATTKWCKLSLSASPSESHLSPDKERGDISERANKKLCWQLFSPNQPPSPQPSSRHTFLPTYLYFCFLLDTVYNFTINLFNSVLRSYGM